MNSKFQFALIAALSFSVLSVAHPLYHASVSYAYQYDAQHHDFLHFGANHVTHSLDQFFPTHALHPSLVPYDWRFYTDIVGGVPYSNTQWASQTPNFFARVEIRVRPFYDNPASCGATVIGPNTLVSAAHCFKFPNSLRYLPLPFLFVPKLFINIHIGSVDTSMDGTRMSIKDIFIPDSYHAGNRDGDIAVIVLDDIIPGDVYSPAPVYPAPTDGAEGLTFGLGLQDDAMKPSDYRQLRLARVSILPTRSCRSGALCSKTISDTSGGLCRHDSGSPLLLFQNNQFLLVGISRAASPVACLPRMKTHYYTTLTPYLDDLATFISGSIPPDWVKYTHGARFTWDRDENLI